MKDRIRHNKIQMDYYWRNHDARRKSAKESYKKHSLRRRSEQFERMYGITLEERDRRIHEQGNVCPACGEAFSGTGKEKLAPSVHHDHSIDVPHVLAIIHLRCNLIMGQAMDDPKLLRKVTEFAEKLSSDPPSTDGPTIEGAT